MSSRAEHGLVREVGGENCRCSKSTPNHASCTGWSARAEEFVDWPNPEYTAPKTVTSGSPKTSLTAMANRINGAGKDEADEGKSSWTNAQRMLVQSAITQVAEARDEFTTDDVWAVLGKSVPKTPGMAAMLAKASRQGFIEATERYADSRRSDRADHDAGRRLRVWRSHMR